MSQFQARVAAGNDNAHRWPGDFAAWHTSDIEIGHPVNHATDYHEDAYLRWDNVNIPPGATIQSAYVTLSRWYTSTLALGLTIKGIDEDDTADFASDASGRAQTTAGVNWDPSSSWTADTEQTSPDIKTIIQEIVDRAGWASGNAIGLRINDRNSALYTYGAFNQQTAHGALAPQLTINYVGSSASASISPSGSVSPSASASASRSPSASASRSLSPSASFSPSPESVPLARLLVAKPGVDARKSNDPSRFIFHSGYGTLKYFYKGQIDVTVKSNVTDLEIAAKATYTHNLGYFPFVEVYMKSPTGIYYPCPAILSGASVSFSGDYQVKENTIDFYATNSGYPGFSGNQTYTFIFFVYKNDLGL